MSKNILLMGMLIGLIVMTIFVSGCAQNKISDKGYLEGKITIGPLCPVERIPPDPGCQPTQETYNAWPIAVYMSNSKIIDITPNLDGTYKVELSPGDYIVKLENQQASGIGRNNLPATVTIRPNATTILDISIDTGIR